MNLRTYSLLILLHQFAPVGAKELVRKKEKIVDINGEILDVDDDADDSTSGEAQSKSMRRAVSVDAHGDLHYEQPRVKEETSFVDIDGDAAPSDVGIGVSEALRAAKAELAAQIEEQKKAKRDTDLALNRAKMDKDLTEQAHKSATRWLKIWTKKAKALQAAIKAAEEKISTLTSLSNSQQAEIDRLTAAHAAKHNAAQVAADLEQLIASLTSQIKNKRTVKKETVLRHTAEREKATNECNAKIQQFVDTIGTITASINEAQKELDLLNQQHTSTSCATKKQKKEAICKRCSSDEKPCGDTCIAKNAVCHHDPGCACEGDVGDGLLEQPVNPPAHKRHPLRKKLREAKATIRKAIAEHQSNIDSLKASMETNAEKRENLEKQKQRALADYDAAMKELKDEHNRLSEAHSAAKQSKNKAEAHLDSTIAEGHHAIKQLHSQLSKSISDLKAERKAQEEARAKKVTACAEEAKALADTQGNVISALDSEIAQLQQELSDAKDKLADIEKSHIGTGAKKAPVKKDIKKINTDKVAKKPQDKKGPRPSPKPQIKKPQVKKGKPQKRKAKKHASKKRAQKKRKAKKCGRKCRRRKRRRRRRRMQRRARKLRQKMRKLKRRQRKRKAKKQRS